MNIRQLQLDDLVLYSGKVCRITEVRLDNDGKVRAVVENDDFCGFVDEVEPIPLTQEILDKNGFENMGNCYGELKIGEYRIMCDARNIAILHNEHVDVDVPVEFVHELQNVLSICRIEKKIEL